MKKKKESLDGQITRALKEFAERNKNVDNEEWKRRVLDRANFFRRNAESRDAYALLLSLGMQDEQFKPLAEMIADKARTMEETDLLMSSLLDFATMFYVLAEMRFEASLGK